MELRIGFLLIIVAMACLANRVKDTDSSNDEDSRSSKALIQSPFYSGSKALVRHKRGWGSVLFMGASILIRTTSLGLSLGAALSEGCMYYRSICNDKAAIERLDKEVNSLVSRYEHEYATTKKTYFDLRAATVNNGYIQYYINQSMQAVEKIQDIEETLVDELEIMLPKLSNMHEASQNLTYDQFLKATVGQLEYRLSDIRNMLLQNKKMALIWLAVQYVIEATINRFVKAFQTAYTQVSESSADILASTNADLWERMDANEPTVKKQGFFKKVKLVPKVLKQMAKNAGKGLKQFGRDIKNWKRIKNWEGFKWKLQHTFRKPIAKLKSVKEFFNPKTNKQFVKGYKLSWSARIMTGIGIIGDVITQVIQKKQWEKVAKQMTDARKGYEDYKNKLTKELAAIEAEKQKMNEYWNDIIEVFKNLSTPFKTLIINASQHLEFASVVGLAKLPIDTSSPFFKINFDNVNKQTISSDQTKVLNFLQSVYNDIKVIEDKMKARSVLYQHTLSASQNDTSIFGILSAIQTIFRFSPSTTMKTYGSQLKLKDIICTVSMLRMDLTEYDFFPLTSFRPNCDVSDATLQTLLSQAAQKRKSKLMKTVVKKEVNKGRESLSRVLDAVHNAYSGVSDPDVKQFGSSVTEQDIICVIAKEFPSKQKYDLIPLTPFRPDCSAVSASRFQQMNDGATKLRALSTTITTFVNICKQQLLCTCLSATATQNQVTENDIIDILKQIDPLWKPNPSAAYCSPPPTLCNCNHF